MRRRYVLAALAAITTISLAMPAFGAPSPLSTAKKALSTAKKANKAAKSASKRSRTALNRANAARTLAQTANTTAGQALGAINSPGGVPRAARADTAGVADTARSAENAGNAGTAAQLAGFNRVDKLVRVVATTGANEAAGRSAAPRTPLGSSGPFTYYAKCFTDDSVSETRAEILVESSVDGAIFDADDNLDGDPFLNDDTPEDERQLETVAVGDNAAEFDGDEEPGNLVTPDLQLHQVLTLVAAKRGSVPGGNGLYGDGNACLFGLQTLR